MKKREPITIDRSFEKPIYTAESARKLRWNEEEVRRTFGKEKREKGGPGSGHWAHLGRPGKIGGSSPGGGLHRLGLDPSSTLREREGAASELERQREKLRSILKKEAEELGFQGPVSFGGRGHEFSVAGQNYTAAGEYNPETGRITIFIEGLTPDKSDITNGIMAHEVAHDLFHRFDSKAKQLDEEVTKRLRDEVKRGVPWQESFMRPDGVFRDAKDRKRYAILAFQDRFYHERQAIEDADGVTMYSWSYWKRAKETGRTRDYWLAINETFAEVARLKSEGREPPSDAKLWNELYSEMVEFAGED